MNFDVLPNEIIVHICRFDSEAYNIISRLSRHHYALSKVITDPKKWFSRYINGLYYEYYELPNGDLHGPYVTYYECDEYDTKSTKNTKNIKSIKRIFGI